MRMPPGSTRVALVAVCAVAALGLALALALRSSGGGSPAASVSSSPAGSVGGLDGTALPQARAAPTFALTDENGHRRTLGDDRGRVVVLAFLYTGCGAPCVLTAQQIRGALDELRAGRARAPAVLIVSADPSADTRARRASFLARMSLSGRASFLNGPLARVRRIWSAYRVEPASAGRPGFEQHASVLVIDARGEERALLPIEQLSPETLARDVAALEPSG